MISKLLSLFFCSILLVTSWISDAYGQSDRELIWSGVRGVFHVMPGEANIKEIALVDGTQIRDLRVDDLNSKVYWIDVRTGKIKRSNLDGTVIESVITKDANLWGLSLHLKQNKMYWIEGPERNIMMSNLNGSSMERVGTAPASFLVSLDMEFQKVYAWLNKEKKFQVTNFDGSDRIDLPVGKGDKVTGILVNSVDHSLLWSTTSRPYGRNSKAFARIWRSNLDSFEPYVLNVRRHFEYWNMALDPTEKRMYWTAGFPGYPSYTGKIVRSNLDGSLREDLVTYLDSAPQYVSLDLTRKKMYWIASGKVERARLDGREREVIIDSAVLTEPYAMAFDSKNNKLYWVNVASGSDSIQRSDVDGKNHEILVESGQVNPGEIALDIAGGKMYWINSGYIHRANLDGTELENVIKDDHQNKPSALALDLSAGKMYWTVSKRNQPIIMRSNLDGSEQEEVLKREGYAFSLRLDERRGKIYWLGPDGIHRANLDGTMNETLLEEGLKQPMGLALDLDSEKMYWADNKANAIMRANLDGTTVEKVMYAYRPFAVVLK